jgi:hypothetical protein
MFSIFSKILKSKTRVTKNEFFESDPFSPFIEAKTVLKYEEKTFLKL